MASGKSLNATLGFERPGVEARRRRRTEAQKRLANFQHTLTSLPTILNVTGDAALVGRRAELRALDELLEALHGEAFPGVAQVVGEPGIGKTRLLAELSARAERHGDLVLLGRAAEFEQDLSFGVFAAALDDYLASLELQTLDGLDPEWYPELATVFPAFVRLAGGRPAGLQAERYRTYRAVGALLEELALRRPLLLVLDDLHWADPASAELLAHMLAHPLRAPVLVVVAFRPAQVPAGLKRTLADAVRQATSRRITIGPLTQAEADQLVPATLPRAEIYREAGGNPFYLDQLVRGAGLDGREPSMPLAEVPPAVAAAIAGELASLSPTTRMLVQSAAVVGDPFDDWLVAAVADVEEDDALDALDRLVELDLIRLTPVPRRLTFRHPILRRAIYESARAGWRVRAHARAADHLRRNGTVPAAFAHHVARSARWGDLDAIDVLVQAGDATSARAPATAAHWYQAALRLLPDGPAHETRRLGLLVALATNLGTAGRLEESHSALCEALERLEPGAPGRVGLVAFCAAVETLLGRHSQAQARLQAALSERLDPDSPDAAALTVELAVGAIWRNDYGEAVKWGERALAVPNTGQPNRAIAAASIALARLYLGDTGAGKRYLDEASALFDALDDAGLAERLDAGFFLSWTEGCIGRYDDAIRHADRALAVSRATGQGHFVVPIMIAKVWALTWNGRLGEAVEVATAAVEAAGVSHVQVLATALWLLCFATTQAGDLDRAVEAGRKSVELFRPLDDSVVKAASGVWLGSALIEAGEVERGRSEILAGAGGPGLASIGRVPRTLVYDTLTRAELALGRADAADDWARRAEEVADGGELPVETGSARRARAAVLLATGDFQRAADLALAAADAALEVGASVESGRTRIVAGRALARAGERELAVVQLEQAEAVLASCGALRYRDDAASELRRLGGPRARQGARGLLGMEALTERERMVAELVSAGKTNREIAAECYLSTKTVERHVSHLFTKLGVRTRAAVAAAVARRQ